MGRKSRKQNRKVHVNQYARNNTIVDKMNSAADSAGISKTEAEKIVRGTFKESFNDSHREFISAVGGNDEIESMREKLSV